MSARKKKSDLEFQKIKICASVATGLCMRVLGRYPTAAELARFTTAEPKLFPRPWTEQEAQWALDNPKALLGVGE